MEGGSEDLVEAVKTGDWSSVRGLTERQRRLCVLAEKLSKTPTRMVESDWEPLRELGFDDRACLEIGHIVGMFNYLTRLADGFGLVLDAGTMEASSTGEALVREGKPGAAEE